MEVGPLSDEGERRLTAVETHMEHVLSGLDEIKAAVRSIDGRLGDFDQRYYTREDIDKRLRPIERKVERLPTWASMGLGAGLTFLLDLIGRKIGG